LYYSHGSSKQKPLGHFLAEIIEVIIKGVMIDLGLSLRPEKEARK
jgi:hypothetical protein